MSRTLIVRSALVAGLAACLLSFEPAVQTAPEKPSEDKVLAAALKKATVNGKYRMLLRQFKFADDKNNYGDFNDYGSYSGTDYAGFSGLPRGYWVYVAPYWYIWGDLKPAISLPKRAWGPEQVTGPPDTEEAGDQQTAWASATQDGQDEWLLLEYAEPIQPKEILVHETYNPGAVTRATAFKLDGTEVEVWKGKDPSAGKDIGVSVLPFKGTFKTNRIKLTIESTKVPGWNEIDAVGLKDARGKTFWAASAVASSSFAEPRTPTDVRDQRIRQLEREVRELKVMIRKLEAELDKQDRKKKDK